MIFRRIKSDNPVKKPVVEVLKKMYGANKVTDVKENDVSFSANLFRHLGNRKYTPLGNKVVTKSELVEKGVTLLASTSEVLNNQTLLNEMQETKYENVINIKPEKCPPFSI